MDAARTVGSGADGPGARAGTPAAPGKRRARWPRWIARALLVVLALLSATATLLPQGRAVTRGALLLPPVFAGKPLGIYRVIGEPIAHRQLTIEAAAGPVYLDVWEPVAPPPPLPGARGGLLIIPGVGDERAEPQLVNLVTALAQAGEVVMAMTTPTLIAYDLAPDDRDAVVRTFDRLTRWPGVGADRVGIVGFSAGGPLACVSAVDARIRDRVRFIVQFGGYYDVRHLLGDIARQSLLVDGRAEPWQPQSVAQTVLANVLAHALPPAEGARLASAFAFQDAVTLEPGEVARLSPEGLAAYHLLAGDDPAHVDDNIATLQPRAGDLLDSLSPSAVVGQLRAPIYLLHDRADQYIPFTEARDFDAALNALGHRHDYIELTAFSHTEVRQGNPLGEVIGDGARLARILYDVLVVGS
jgi:acetyl esterase/lipase